MKSAARRRAAHGAEDLTALEWSGVNRREGRKKKKMSSVNRSEEEEEEEEEEDEVEMRPTILRFF